MNPEEIQTSINSDNVDKIYEAIISASLYGEDYKLAINLCKKFIQHPDVFIKRACILSLPYISFNFDKLDFNLANHIIEDGIYSTEPLLVGTAEVAIEDLEYAYKGYKFLRKMGYTNIHQYSSDQLSSQIKSSNTLEIIEAIISAAMYGTDYDLAITICDTLINHINKNVRIACIYALVYIAFFNFHELSKQVAHNVLTKGLNDKNKQVALTAQEVIDYLQSHLEGFSFIN
jgi:hypothetical protein